MTRAPSVTRHLIGALLVGGFGATALAGGCGARSTLLDGLADVGVGGAGGQAATSVGPGPASISATSATSTTSVGPGGAGGADCTPEVCDGLDNDCDGAVDEGCGCVPGEVAACYSADPGTLGVGLCQAGKTVCEADGQFGPCLGEVTPTVEVCNGLDDDCDGFLDEACSTGCSDGTREGYLDLASHPHIAACAGGWSVPGILSTLAPACGQLAGDDSANPSGAGCNVADLCAPGFHVCLGADDVAASSPTGCAGAAPVGGLFFTTRQSGPGCGLCALGVVTDPNVCTGCSCADDCAPGPTIANDLFGCGTVGAEPGDCGVLDRFSGNGCDGLGAPWSCLGGCDEANSVTKGAASGGGVLCCAD